MEISLGASGYTKYARIIDSKTSGTAAQTLLAQTWTTMELTTIDSNEDGVISSIASNQFTLSSGAKNMVIDVMFFKKHAAADYAPPFVRLYDVTAGSVYKSHVTPYYESADLYLLDAASSTHNQYKAMFRVPAPSSNVYRIEVISVAASNMGVARSATSTNEIYKVLDVWST